MRWAGRVASETRETVGAFLAALFVGCPGVIELRALPSRARHFGPVDELDAHLAFLFEHRTENVHLGIATRRDASSGALDNCAALGALFVDLDFKNTPEAEARTRLAVFPHSPSVEINSGGGLHLYWCLKKPLRLPGDEPVARDLLRRLARALGGDMSAAEPAHILRVPHTLNFKYTPARRVTVETLDSGCRYDIGELAGVLPAEPEAARPAGPFRAPGVIREGQRRTTIFRLARAMRWRNLSLEAALAALQIENAERCLPPLTATQVQEQVENAYRRRDRTDFRANRHREDPVGDEQDEGAAEEAAQSEGHISMEDACGDDASPEAGWPTMAPAAYYGLPGRIVEAVAPCSESDPVAILLHTLVATGNVFGPDPHALVERDPHPARLYVGVVGRSSKARKGTAWGTPRTIVKSVDPGWAIKSGLSTGEGLIYHVRDRVEPEDPETGKRSVADQGIADKRVLIIETELSTVLARMTRDGNTLSPAMRDAWDHGQLSTLTRNSPLRATGAHVSIVGHITPPELTRQLTSTEMANGFGNRFLWVCVQRARLLPDGGGINDATLVPLVAELKAAVTAAAGIGLITRDGEARDAWHAVYGDLSRERDGLVGSLLARAEAQVLRLSVVYALLDQSPVIQLPHLEAALAVWSYCEASVLYIWGTSLGHPVADTILEELRRRGRMTRTEIRALLGGRVRADAIEEALVMLERSGLIRRGNRNTGGRPEEYAEAR